MSSVFPPELQAPVLWLDAASPRLSAGLILEGEFAGASGQPGLIGRWRQSDEEAGVALFRTTDALLHEVGLKLTDVRAIVFCDGPGSLLGVRLVAMALRTWMALPRGTATEPLRVWAYRSLALIAADLLAGGVNPPFHVCTDARRDSWNLLSVTADGSASNDTIRRVPAAGLPAPEAGTLFHPETFPHWQPLPAHARPAPYRPQHAPALLARFPQLLHATDAPDAFLTEAPTYRTWTPAQAFPA